MIGSRLFSVFTGALLVGSLCDCTTIKEMLAGSAPTSLNFKAGLAPTVQITSPRDSDSFSSGQITEFEGQGTDLFEGQLPSSSLSWWSSVDGPLGSGSAISARLSGGTAEPTYHRITLRGVNKAGLPAEQSITVVVAQQGKARRASPRQHDAAAQAENATAAVHQSDR